MSAVTQEARFAPRASVRKGVKLNHIKGRAFTYAFLIAASLVVLMPLYVMLVTSLKSMDEIRTGSMLALPSGFDFTAWAKAWSAACTGMECGGVSAGFLNSVMIVVPAVAVSIAFGIVTGYAFALTEIRLGSVVFAILMLGTFLPWQIFVFPIGRIYSALGLYGSIWSL
jgi:glucose/mannose transport system permease protein